VHAGVGQQEQLREVTFTELAVAMPRETLTAKPLGLQQHAQCEHCSANRHRLRGSSRNGRSRPAAAPAAAGLAAEASARQAKQEIRNRYKRLRSVDNIK
jgi:hypothetical protein